MKSRIITLVVLMLLCSAVYTVCTRGKDNSEKLMFGMIRQHDSIGIPKDPQPGNRSVKGDQFKKGDTLATLLARHGVTAGEVHYIGLVIEDVYPPNKIKVGSEVIIFRNARTQEVEEIQIQRHLDSWVSIKRNESDWLVESLDHNLFIRVHTAVGKIDNSLWNAAREQDIPAETILDLADLFGWQVDFTSGLRKDDSFGLIYQKKIIKDGKSLPGDILAARFVNADQEFFGYRQVLGDGSVEYYDDSCNSLRRDFLKTPLRYRCISSGYSKSRYHPILKTYRPHLGIDYAAPRGTPVSSLGDGIVVFCGTRGGYGKYIQVKHGDAYETCYGHLSGYATGVKKGARVSQGQVIGYVGSTGLSTGPHLDFRVKYRGTFVNPNTIRSEPAAPLPEELRDEFMVNRDRWKTKLSQ